MEIIIPTEVTKAIGGLKKDLSSNSTISSTKLAERTLEFLEDSLTQIYKKKPNTNLKDVLTLLKDHSNALQLAAAHIIKDDSQSFKVIINNLTMRVLKILRSDLGEDEVEDLSYRNIEKIK